MRLAEVIPSIPGIDAVIPSAGRGANEVAVKVRQLLAARGIPEANAGGLPAADGG